MEMCVVFLGIHRHKAWKANCYGEQYQMPLRDLEKFHI